ncbi:unnamed protein product [Nesidiocoris tenuis]|uniref:Uncharacterized protein n=1 Tax=Nesidiocoris tenuis TaxID=355587 RepID=A0A6H5HJJ4_9HEMI|nr:unnamed protein product [Nesidiocoris tenuis]
MIPGIPISYGQGELCDGVMWDVDMGVVGCGCRHRCDPLGTWSVGPTWSGTARSVGSGRHAGKSRARLDPGQQRRNCSVCAAVIAQDHGQVRFPGSDVHLFLLGRIPAGRARTLRQGDAETTTTLPMTTDESTTVTSTQQTTMTSPTTMVTTESERGTETPLLIIVANTTDQPESTTDRETFAATDNSDVRTSTELPATMTTLSMSTTTDCDDCSTTTSPSTGGFFFSQSQNGDSYETNTAMTTNDDFPTTTRPTAFRPSAYLPAAGDEYLHYQQSQDQHNNHVRQSTTTDRTGSVDSLIRPQSHRFSTTPAPSTLWPEDDPLPYGTRLDFSTTYTTRRSTVRFPSERPAVLSAVPTNGYIRFPPTHDPPWWPPSWAGQQIHQSQWPPHPQRLGISGRPWGSNREPRPSWNLQ